MNDPDKNKTQYEMNELEKNKTQAEIDKLKAEEQNLREKSYFSYISNWISVVTNSLVIIAGIYFGLNLIPLQQEVVRYNQDKIDKQDEQLQEQDEQLQEQDEQLQEQDKQLKQQDKQLKEQDKQLKELESDKETRTGFGNILRGEKEVQGIVVIQFRGSLTRSLMNELAQSYQKKNYNSPGVERLAGSYENMVRYFHNSDQQLAQKVANIAQDFFEEKGCPIRDIKLDSRKPNEFPNAQQEQVELWIHHSCS